MNAFLWLISREVILTWNNLQKRGWIGPWICTLCSKAEENIDHIFFSNVHMPEKFGD